MHKNRIWLTGAGGQLGTALRALFPNPETFEWLPTYRTDIDLTDLDAVRSFIRTHKPDAIVNAAAYTAVDLAESEVQEARLLNAELPRVLAEELAKYDGTLIHVSTDYVFGGDESRMTPYDEEDETSPLGVYGQTKADGEETLMMLGERYYILRTAWLYGPIGWGKSFYRAIRERVLRGEPLKVVTDEIGSPTSTISLASVIFALVRHLEGCEGLLPFGLYHFANAGDTSRHHFAEVIAEMTSGHPYEVAPITHADLKSAARRPEYSALDTTKIGNYLPEYILSWEEALREVVAIDQKESK